jgi:hypothetical protein
LAVATLAVLVVTAAALPDTLTVKEIVLLSAGASTALLVQVAVDPLAAQLQPAPLAETKPKPVGNGSVTVMGPTVLPAPTLLTVSV